MNKQVWLATSLSMLCSLPLATAAWAQSDSSAAAAATHTDAGSPLENGAPTGSTDAAADTPATSGALSPNGGIAAPGILENADEGPHVPAGGGKPRVISTPAAKSAAAGAATKINPSNPSAHQRIKQSLEAKEFHLPPNAKRPTIALALGGGGARGAAHIGVINVLRQEGIPIDYIVGNSMGSIIGGMYASGVPLNTLAQITVDKSLRKAYFPGWIPPKAVMVPLLFLREKLFAHNQYAGLFGSRKFEDFMAGKMPHNKQTTFKDLQVPFSAVATNLVDGKAYTISSGNLPRALTASSAISPLIRPVEIGDKLYVDGGVRANLPARAAKDAGADLVIGVLVDEPIHKTDKARYKKLKNIALRMSDIVLAINDEKQLPFADIIINPDVSGIPTLSKNGQDAARAIQAGEKAARKALPEIRRKIAEKRKQQEQMAKKQEEKVPQPEGSGSEPKPPKQQISGQSPVSHQ